MKVLFLDVDGVLNNECYFMYLAERGYGVPMEALDPDCLDRLKRIVDRTDCRIVLSSTWRIWPESIAYLTEALFTFDIDIHSVTPVYTNLPRRAEIRSWLVDHDDVECYAILDDDSDADTGDGSFFQTKWKTGLTVGIADTVINHFEASKNDYEDS